MMRYLAAWFPALFGAYMAAWTKSIAVFYCGMFGADEGFDGDQHGTELWQRLNYLLKLSDGPLFFSWFRILQAGFSLREAKLAAIPEIIRVCQQAVADVKALGRVEVTVNGKPIVSESSIQPCVHAEVEQGDRFEKGGE